MIFRIAHIFLHAAVRAGSLEVVEMLLRLRVNVNAMIPSGLWSGVTPLRAAFEADGDRLAMIKLLLRRGADANAGPPDTDKPLHWAIRLNSPNLIQLLLDHGADINAPGYNGYSPLSTAFFARGDCGALIEWLLQRGADANAGAPETDRPLHLATSRKSLDIMKLLLDHGAAVDVAGERGQTPLYRAVSGKERSCIELLLAHGADVDTRGWHGKTLLQRSINRWDDTEMAELLLAHEASLEARDESGNTALLWVAFDGGEKFLDLFLDRGAELEARNRYGRTPLLVTALKRNPGINRAFLDRGAAIDVRDNDGRTVLHHAVDVWLPECRRISDDYYLDVITLMVERGADVRAADHRGFTPLHVAAGKGMFQAVAFLVQRGAELQARAQGGVTPLLHGAASGRPAMAYVVRNGLQAGELGRAEGRAMLEARTDGGETAFQLVRAQMQRLGELAEMEQREAALKERLSALDLEWQKRRSTAAEETDSAALYEQVEQAREKWWLVRQQVKVLQRLTYTLAALEEIAQLVD